MRDAVIVEAVRTPVGKRNGGLSGVHPVELSAHVLRSVAERKQRLLAAEARHYRTFLDLAVLAADGEVAKVEARLRDLAVVEGVIVSGLPSEAANPTVHG